MVTPAPGVSQKKLESFCVARTLRPCPGAVLGSDPSASRSLGVGGRWGNLSADWLGDWLKSGMPGRGSLEDLGAESGLGQQVAVACPQPCGPRKGFSAGSRKQDTGRGFQLAAGSSSPGGCGEQPGRPPPLPGSA